MPVQKNSVPAASAGRSKRPAETLGKGKLRAQTRRVRDLAGLVGKMAHLRHADTTSSKSARASVVGRLLSLHGLPQKIGQILSLGELASDDPQYLGLTEGAQTLPAAEFFAQMEAALGRPYQQCFSRVEKTGTAASIAQVHRAWLADGRAVAVKVQYPEISHALEMDLRALGWLTIPVGGLRRGFDLAGYRSEVGSKLREEVDFIHEARMMQRFSALARDLECVEVPEVIEELSRKTILTMTWLDGEPFACTRKWSLSSRCALAETLVELFLKGIFQWGLLHADPHSGNYRFSLRNGRPVVGLLDFGCVAPISEETKDALVALIEDVRTDRLGSNSALAQTRFEALGFERRLLEPMAHLLPDLAAVLFEPFRKEGEFSPRQWRLSERVQEILGDFRWNFRMAGPPELIYFVRAFQGLLQYLIALETPVDWYHSYETIRPVKGGAATPNQLGDATFPMNGLSKFLHICVSEHGKTKAEITFRAGVAENLPEIVPPEIEQKLVDRGIDVQKLANEAANANFPPGELFHLDEGEKKIRVWLE
jgi:predicted unusual protein kinase regulating ubiquinone biosynthesis (AarF/ABC1/UbiB family)